MDERSEPLTLEAAKWQHEDAETSLTRERTERSEYDSNRRLLILGGALLVGTLAIIALLFWRAQVAAAPAPEVPAAAPTLPPDAPEAEKPGVDCTIPPSAISSTDSIQPFSPAHGRFSKVPAYLVPIYEQACEDYRIPVRYLAADGSYETHFNPRKIGDSGNSCGIHQFNRQNAGKKWPRNWGFKDLPDCLNAESNIRKAAEFWRSMLDKKRICNGDISCAVRRHNGVNSYGYMRTVMGGADRYYKK